MLNNDAVPSLLKQNAEKQPQKIRSIMQEKKKELNNNFMRMLFSHNKRMQVFQFSCNAKGIERKTSTFSSAYTQIECQLQSDFAALCNTKYLRNDHSPVSIEQERDQSEFESQNECDNDFIINEKSCNKSKNNISILISSHHGPLLLSFAAFF